MRASEDRTPERHRFANLDGLRGLAALAVVVSHLSSVALVSVRDHGPPVGGGLVALYTLANYAVNLGRVGVIVFFLISGYLIPFSLSGRDTTRHFLISRFFRLYPLFWTSLAVATVLRIVMGEPPSTWQVLANITMIPDAIGSTRLLDVYWTLAIEFCFYALVLVQFLCFGPMRFRTAAVSAAAFFGASLAISAAQARGLHVPLADKLYLFGVMYLGTAMRLRRPGSRRETAFVLGLVAACAVALWSRAHIHVDLQVYGPPNEFIGFRSGIASDLSGLALFAAGVSFSGSLPVLVRLGIVSYSLYILHPLVIDASDGLGLTRPLAAAGLYVPALLGLSIALSILSHRWIEAPGIALGRAIRGRLRGASEGGAEGPRRPSARGRAAVRDEARLGSAG